jgi:hypothetical protein
MSVEERLVQGQQVREHCSTDEIAGWWACRIHRARMVSITSRSRFQAPQRPGRPSGMGYCSCGLLRFQKDGLLPGG